MFFLPRNKRFQLWLVEEHDQRQRRHHFKTKRFKLNAKWNNEREKKRGTRNNAKQNTVRNTMRNLNFSRDIFFLSFFLDKSVSRLLVASRHPYSSAMRVSN